MTRRSFGEGSIDERSKGVFRLRYRTNGKRFAKTVQGTRSEANKMLRALLRSADTGTHVAPARLTFEAWMEHWLSVGCPGKRRKEIGARARERYAQLLRRHVVPVLGHRPLQGFKAPSSTISIRAWPRRWRRRRCAMCISFSGHVSEPRRGRARSRSTR